MGNAEVNKKDHYGFFPLLVSLRNEKYEIADQLLLAGADIHSKTFVGDTALHVLIQDQAPMRSIQFLLARGASLFRQNAKRETPLFAALHNHDLFDFLLYWLNTSQQRQHESFIPILKALSMTNDLGQSVIHRNCEIKGTTGVNNLMAIINALPFGNTSLLAIPSILSEPKFGLNTVFSKNRRTPRGSTPTFYETLLNEQDSNLHTPLMLAVMYDNTQLVDVLVTALETKLDIKNSKDETALEMAVRLGRPEAMTHIIAAQKYQPAKLQRKKSKAEIILGA
jgi:ankyrin repeat protein